MTLDDAARATHATVSTVMFVDHKGEERSSFKFAWGKDCPIEYMRDVRIGDASSVTIEQALQHALDVMEERYHGGQNAFNEFLKNGGAVWPVAKIASGAFAVPTKAVAVAPAAV